MKARVIKISVIAMMAGGLASCGHITKEDQIQTAGAIGGGALGYSLGETDSEKAAYGTVGALAGGLATAHFAGNQDFAQGREVGKNEGYSLGRADSAKRLYWLQQGVQGGGHGGGSVTLREVEIAPTLTEDGRYIMARKVMVPVVDAP